MADFVCDCASDNQYGRDGMSGSDDGIVSEGRVFQQGWDLPLPNEAAGVIAEGHVGRAAKGWAVATLSEPDHDKALAESWWALSTRHPDIVLQQHLSHDWIADAYSRGPC